MFCCYWERKWKNKKQIGSGLISEHYNIFQREFTFLSKPRLNCQHSKGVLQPQLGPLSSSLPQKDNLPSLLCSSHFLSTMATSCHLLNHVPIKGNTISSFFFFSHLLRFFWLEELWSNKNETLRISYFR